MNISVRHLRVFAAVAEANSFTGAAAKIGLSQPAVTSTIQQLEDEFASPLFLRTTRQVRLTEEGVSFLPTALRLLDEFDNAFTEMKAASALRSTRISLAVLPSIAVLFLPRIIEAMMAVAPQFKAHIRDLNSSAIYRRVRAGEVDLGLGTQWDHDADLNFKPLVVDQLVMVAGGGHPLAQTEQPVEWQEVVGNVFCNMASDTGIRPLIDEAGGVPEGNAETRLEFSNVLTLASVLERNIGVTAMPYLTYLSLRSAQLTYRPLEGKRIERSICAITRKGSTPTPPVTRLLEILSQQITTLQSNKRHAPYVRTP